MDPFHEMLRKVRLSPNHDQLLRFTSPLKDLFAINHFWYYRITFSGHYSFFGTHTAWSEYCFDNALLSHFPCLRHPDALRVGVQLMKTESDNKFQDLLKLAWEKFQINFSVNLLKKTKEGVEAFGFATCFNDSKVDERIINDLPYLTHFAKTARIKYKNLFEILKENQVDLPSRFGAQFYEQPKSIVLAGSRIEFLRKIGLETVLRLSPRELDVLRFISCGYPASYIAKELKLSRRTVENYLATIKDKLNCNSKVELIQKTQEITSTGYFDFPI